MFTGMLVFAAIMGCVAIGVVIASAVAEMSEAWNIKQVGWVRGHRQHRHG